MAASAPSVESIREGFPYPTIPKQNGLPTYESIKEIHMKLKSNAASLPSSLGGGAHGHLGLILSDTIYHTFTGHHFVQIGYPGAVATIPAGQPSAALIGETVRQHAATLRAHYETLRADQALKQQILSVFTFVHTT